MTCSFTCSLNSKQTKVSCRELNKSSLEAVKGLKAGMSDIEKNLEKLEERYVLEGLGRKETSKRGKNYNTLSFPRGCSMSAKRRHFEPKE